MIHLVIYYIHEFDLKICIHYSPCLYLNTDEYIFLKEVQSFKNSLAHVEY